MKRKYLSTIIAGLIAGVGANTTAIAQGQADAPRADGLILEELVVTARKREELLSDIPIAITALSAQDIEAAGFENIKDLAKATPGFVFEAFDTTPGRFDSVPFIRGITFDNPSPIRQSVSVFIDGVYVAGGTAGIGVEDVQRIEIIKGPQSAQFGRATYSGAINYITVDPSEETKGKIGVTAASRDEYEITGSVEGQLAQGLTARLSGRFASKDGHFTNSQQASQRLGDQETSSVGLTLLYQTDNFKARLRGFHSELDDGPAATALFDSTFGTLQPGGIRPFLTGTIPDVPSSIIGGNSTDADFDTFIADARDINALFIGGEPSRFGLERSSDRLSLDLSYDFGNVVLSGNIASNSEEATSVSDFDQNPRTTFTFITGREFEDESAEVRLSGLALNERLNWSVGASRLEIDFNNNGAFGFQAFGQSASFGARTNTDQQGRTNPGILRVVTTDGIFGQLGYAITDKLNITLEARDQEESIDVREQGNPGVSDSFGVFDSFLPRVTFDYKPNDDTLLYATYSEGNLAGGFNPAFLDLSPSQQAEVRTEFSSASGTFDEEELDSFEIGWKQSLLDNRLDFSVAIYRFERLGQQTSALATVSNPLFGQEGEPQFTSTTLQVNAAASDIDGIEIESNYYPNDNWSFRGTFAYTDAVISAFPASGNSGDFNFAFGNSDNFIGTAAPRYPEIQASLSATYTQSTTLLGANSWFVRGDLFYQDEFFVSTANLGVAPSSTEINLRTGLRADKWSLEAFVTNLTDEDAPTAANNTAVSVPTGLFPFTEATAVGLRDKTQFGIRASYSF